MVLHKVGTVIRLADEALPYQASPRHTGSRSRAFTSSLSWTSAAISACIYTTIVVPSPMMLPSRSPAPALRL